jgi:hypothetical protein
LHVAGFLAVADKGVRVWFAIDVEAGPAVGDDVSMRDVDVLVLADEMGAKNGAKELRRCDGVLLGQNKDGILDGVCCDDDAVVGFGVAVTYISVLLRFTIGLKRGGGLGLRSIDFTF